MKAKQNIEYKLGETFKYKGVRLRVEEDLSGSCENCFFDMNHCLYFESKCSPLSRLDGKSIIFRKIKKRSFYEMWKEIWNIKNKALWN